MKRWLHEFLYALSGRVPSGPEPELWFPKVLVVTDESQHRGRQGSSVEWARADIVVTPSGTVLKNKYGPIGWTDWRS